MLATHFANLHKVAFGDIDDRGDRAILEERYRALRAQLPITFGVFLTNVLGFYAATARDRGFFDTPAWLLSLVVVARGTMLFCKGRRGLAVEEIQRELKRGIFAATLYSLLFCRWALSLFDMSGASEQSFIALIATLSSIGCAYGFSAFPTAGRIPLLLLGVLLGVRLIASGTFAHAGIGLSLLLMIVLTHRMLRAQSQSFKELVGSRTSIADERLRAQNAAAVALREQANAIRVANTDSLTGLGNRRGLLVHLGRLANERCHTDKWNILILVDLDGFKPINDTFGHGVGDAVLVEVAERLRTCGQGVIAYRLGGDEFAVLASAEHENAAADIGERIRVSLGKSYFVQERELRLSACCGVLSERGHMPDPSLALSRSDMALYRAKASGRNCVALFSSDMETRRIRRNAIERALRDPLTEKQIWLAYQPIFDLGTMRPVSFEALARWDHPSIGQVLPSEFIRIAEEIDVIETLGERLLSRAARDAAEWPATLKLALNLSAIQLSSDACARTLLGMARAVGFDVKRLQVEVTETALLADFDAARRTLGVFRSAGAEIVLDDFGAGYASVGYLREMQFDVVKLDGSLVDAALHSQAGERLMKGVIELCQSLGVPCVAEHIDSREALRIARSLGATYGQGYHLCTPCSLAEAGAIFERELLFAA